MAPSTTSADTVPYSASFTSMLTSYLREVFANTAVIVVSVPTVVGACHSTKEYSHSPLLSTAGAATISISPRTILSPTFSMTVPYSTASRTLTASSPSMTDPNSAGSETMLTA